MQGYTGTLLLVSHDRAFLDNVVTQTLAAEGGGNWREYVGGYSDRLAQRPKTIGQPPTASAGAPTGKATAPAKPKSKLSFKEQRELDALPAEIETLELELQQLVARMSDADYHKQSADPIKARGARAGELEALLAQKYGRWEVLDQKAAAGAA